MRPRWKCWTTRAGKHWPRVGSPQTGPDSRSATTTLNMLIVLFSVNAWKYRAGLNPSPRQDRNLPGSSASHARARRWSALALAGSGKSRRKADMSSTPRAGGSMTRKGWLLFIAMSVVWGIPYLFIKIAVRELDPTVVVFGRVATAAVVLLPLAVQRGVLRKLRKRWPAIAALACVQIVGPFLLISFGE